MRKRSDYIHESLVGCWHVPYVPYVPYGFPDARIVMDDQNINYPATAGSKSFRKSGDCWISSFDDSLIEWAKAGFVESHDAIRQNESKRGNTDYIIRCLGAILRRRAKTDAGWFIWAMRWHGNDLLRIVEAMPEGKRVIECGGNRLTSYPPPDHTWRSWLALMKRSRDIF